MMFWGKLAVQIGVPATHRTSRKPGRQAGLSSFLGLAGATPPLPATPNQRPKAADAAACRGIYHLQRGRMQKCPLLPYCYFDIVLAE